MDLTIQQLRYFVTVAEELHFTRAAERLHVAVPSLSQQVTALERRLGILLFHRTSRHVELTEAGAELLPLALRAMASAADIVDWAKERQSVGALLRLGLVVSSPISSAIVAEAARTFPDVRLSIRRLALSEVPDAVRSGKADVVVAPEVYTLHNVSAMPLWSESRVLAVAATHRLANRESVGIDETNEERFVGFEGDDSARRRWFVTPRPNGFVPRIDSAGRGVEEVLDMCSAGLGVGITGTTTALSHARPELAYIPIRDIPDATMYLLRPAGSVAGPVAAFERLAVRVARRDAGRYGARPPAEKYLAYAVDA